MKKYTLTDLKNFNKDECGCIICPSGDYTEIKEFPEQCSFGAGCSFGEECRFGAGCSFGKHCSFGEQCRFGAGCRFENGEVEGGNVRMLQISRIGSRAGCTYFWKHEKGIYVRCGCFAGDIDKFVARVEETHKENPQYLKEYQGAITYARSVLEG